MWSFPSNFNLSTEYTVTTVTALTSIFTGTHTTRALRFVADDVFGTNADFGDRTDDPMNENLVVFLTDGVSTDGRRDNNVGTEAPRVHNVTERVSHSDVRDN